jgi:CPA1 family monovalent cation:H+ antiporter
VIAATAAVAVAAHLVVPDMGWGPAFVLGAILAPTDTVAATTVFRRLGVPDRVVMLVEGESLINDGAALVFWRIGIAGVASGAFSATDAVRDLVIVGAGGALVGLVAGFLVAHVHRRLEDPLLSIMVSLLTPYVAWIGAEHLGLSGILAAVSSGLYLGWRSVDLFNPSTRLQATAFWSAMTFILSRRCSC